jgi:hypothetical protein
MNNLWSEFVALLKWGITFLWGEWFVYVTIALLLNLVISVVWTTTHRSDLWRPRYTVIFLPLLAFPLIALIGAIAWSTGVPVPPLGRPNLNVAASWCVVVLNILAIAVSLLMIFKMKGIRWLSLSVFLFIQWMLQGIDLIVAMPIGGVWL